MALLVFYSSYVFGQSGNSPRSGSTQVGRIYGKVVDSKTNKGLEAASVQVFVSRADTSTAKDSLVGGMLSRPNGDFNFDNLPLIDTFKFMISAVGYKPLELQVFVQPAANGAERDLGNIKMEMG